MLITKAGGRGILSHRLSEYVLNGGVAFADLGSCHRAAGVQVAQLAFDVRLEARAVVALEAAELLHLALKDRALLLQGTEDLAGLFLSVVDEAAGFDLCFGNDLVALLLAVGDVAVVHLLRHGEQARSGLGHATTGSGGLWCNSGSLLGFLLLGKLGGLCFGFGFRARFVLVRLGGGGNLLNDRCH